MLPTVRKYLTQGLLLCAVAGCGAPRAAAAGQVVVDAPTAEPGPVAVAHVSEPDPQPARRALREDDLKALSWRSVGPANMSGRVADIALAPGNPKAFYVGFATGGLFKTINAGTTFAPVFDNYETASIGSVVVADAPPDWPGWAQEQADENTEQPDADRGRAKIVWVGTGEGNGRNSSSWGHGAYRSTDGGASFTHLGLADTHDIPRLAVDPRDPDTCYVAALGHLWGANEERGVYKTTDAGASWQRVLYVNENTGACDVIVDPKDPDTVYAGMYTRRRSAYSFQSGGQEGGIYRSTDAGANWTKLTNGLPPQTGRIGLDIYATDPRIVYAVVESDHGGWGPGTFDSYSTSGGVFRSEDRGESWTRMGDLNPRAFYFSRVRVDPSDDQRIYLLGWTLYVSDDGGRNFRRTARKPHVDMHAFVIDPDDSDHLLMGTDGGIYISHDRGSTWDYLNHLAVGEFYNIAIDMTDPYRIGGGLQDNGSWIGPSETIWQSGGDTISTEGIGITNRDWSFINDGDGFHVAFDPVDPHIVYAESQGGELVRVHLDTGQRKRIKPAPKEGQPRFRFNWNSPFFVSPHDPTVLYLGGNHVFRLSERGDRWERISDDLSRAEVDKITTVGSDAETYGTVVALAESPLVKGLLWAGTDDGLIHVTEDGGGTWRDVTPPEAGGLYISRIEPSHHDRQTAYVSIDGHRSDDFKPRALVTVDGGTTWRSVAGDLRDGWPVKVIREDRANPNVLYCGTEQAAYVSIDRGGHWTKLNGESLPTVAVDDLSPAPARARPCGRHARTLDLCARRRFAAVGAYAGRA